MALPIVAGTAGAWAAAAYLDAKFHIRHDLHILATAGTSPASLFHLWRKLRADRLTVFHILEDQSKRIPNQLFLMFEGRTWTYKQFFDKVVNVGNWLRKDLGIKKGEVVALDAENTAEYLMLWFGLEGIGALPAFVNNNLTSKSLIHCIKLVECRYILVDSGTKPNVEPCEQDMAEFGVKTVYWDQQFIDKLTDNESIPEELRKNKPPESVAGLLYTSGSTGLPKAVNMVTARELLVGYSVARYLRLKPSDRLYTCMPLYHGAAHGLGVTPVINAGCTLVLGRKFSHKRFWPEVRESKANIIQYVGELCRYLINAPEHPQDKDHNVQMAWGNGMRPDVWERFRERFGIPVINELYAATDGLAFAFNENKGDFTKFAIGKKGLIYRILKSRGEALVKVDPDTEEILRDANGFAIRAAINEPGELLTKIDPANPDAAFHGYWKNKEAGDKRKVKDVFKKGDLWFRSGDMHRLDADGRVYFVDRLGDTFRWRSENVSTNEVSDVLGAHPQIAEANVYGVTVPHADGRAGMASIVLADGVDHEKLDKEGVAKHLLDTLPRYAVPIFLRITPQLDYTGTLKMQKGRLKREGIDVEHIEGLGDVLYWLPPNGSRYERFEKRHLESLKAGKVKL